MSNFTVLLRSGWNTINIGDIAHTPGVLRILETYLPGASVILWPNALDRGVEQVLRRRFPRLRIVRHPDRWSAAPGDPSLEEAFEEADLMIHGSGAGLVARGDLARWREKTGKPYGVYGVTLGSPIGYQLVRHERFTREEIDILDGASFVFTRETQSLEAVCALGLRCPNVAFVPDGTFAVDLKDDEAALALLRRHGLAPDGYLCVIPRHRYTPYWAIFPDRAINPREVALKTEVNKRHEEADHAKLRELVVSWVRATGLKVLLCPEVTYEVDTSKRLIYDLLPEDIKPSVVHLDRYWITDEAASVYQRARAVVSVECHSPIIALANHRPAFYLRQPTDTWKGQMYPDLGLGDWMFKIDEAPAATIAERLLDLHEHYDEALAKVDAALKRAHERFAWSAQILGGIAAEHARGKSNTAM